MKTFNEARVVKTLQESVDIAYLNEKEILEAERIHTEILEAIEIHGIEAIDEGILGSIIGGAAGLLAGPALGKIIANALGVERGILYDMLTSRLVTTALGAAIGKRV
jgi:proteasome assembly chaperone (PAC2) family protein